MPPCTISGFDKPQILSISPSLPASDELGDTTGRIGVLVVLAVVGEEVIVGANGEVLESELLLKADDLGEFTNALLSQT